MVSVLVVAAPPAELVGRLAGDGDLHVPHLIDVELLHVLRRLNLTGVLSEERAADALGDYSDLAMTRYPHDVLAGRIWELHHTLTAYDATFVALAEMLGAPLVTCDAWLARAGGHTADVEVFG